MGIFSWLFSKNTESNSYVRRWLGQEMEKLDRNKTDTFALFVELIAVASRFGKDNSGEQDPQWQEVDKQYLGDATLFEIACYTYHQLELWLGYNEPELKAKVAEPIAAWIIEIFSISWKKDEQLVGQLFGECFDMYRKLIRDKSPTEEVQKVLQQRIVNTKGDRLAVSSETNVATPQDAQFIHTSLEVYETSCLPQLIAAVQDYCSRQSKQQVGQAKKLNIEEQLDQEKRDYLFAVALMEQQNFVKACNAFTKVLEGNPDNYNALVQRGKLYVMMRQPENAMQDFSKAIEINPDDAAAYLHRGRCYHRILRRGNESLADYTKAIDLNPDNVEGYLSRGELFDEIALTMEQQALDNNDTEKYMQVSEEFLAAVSDYSQAIALEPEHDEVYAKRGLAYARKARANGDSDFMVKAIADMEKAMSLNWENGYLHKTLDEMKELLGHPAAAIE